ncbi:MAG: S1 RNA-binding domain-containing protein [Patescibacteria group bacterium]|nr:S1 RNA-binding domain-containing protein [Patescibacteria group bacterium]
MSSTDETLEKDSAITDEAVAIAAPARTELSVHSDGPTGAMAEMLKGAPDKPLEKTLVEGTVIGKSKMAVYVDIPPFGTGIIFGREYLNARNIIKEINTGDAISAKVVTPEGEGGYIELSLQEAKQAIVWAEAKQAIDTNATFNLAIKNANRGGLMVEWQGLDGFIPASQLKPEHYPKVADGDKDKIAEELRKLITQSLTVYLISADPKEGKLIFSEKELGSKSRKEIVSKYTLGDVVEGEVTGVVDFGVFVKIEEGFEGLVHISEVDWSLVENLREMFHPGDKIKAKIIEVKDDKVSLSVKALKRNPWLDAEGKYKKGDTVKGVVIRHNKHGALVSIEEGVAGLVHISEFISEDELRQKLELGKTYALTINIFDPKNQKMTMLFGEKKISAPGAATEMEQPKTK